MQQFRPWTQAVILAVVLCALPCMAPAQTAPRYPGAAWEQVPASQSGWSSTQLDVARNLSQGLGSTAVVVVQHGAIVASWGETDANILLNSARKSLPSALIGIAVANAQIHLDAPLGQLGIDDNPPSLSQAEKQATVRDLLEARSGVYHAANYETADMAARRPARGSHPPGTFWCYNNWDFNALGAIYEHATGASVFVGFSRLIARPIGMQDFDPAKCRYSGGADSVYPAYLFYASARDLARFGLLFLHLGRCRDKQIIPAAWVQESTTPYSTTTQGAGYGYLWRTSKPSAEIRTPPGSYRAEGNGGQMVFVIPAYDLVVVHLARSGGTTRGVPLSKVSELLSFILAAKPSQ
jgi:CubicO group peptidase (beta-lactamase class C family)